MPRPLRGPTGPAAAAAPSPWPRSAVARCAGRPRRTGQRTTRRQTAGRPGGTAPPRSTAGRPGPRTPPPCHATGPPAWGSSQRSSATPARESHPCDSPRSRINQRACTLAKNTSHLVADLLRQVERLAELLDGGELRLPVVEVAFLLGDHAGEELAGALVAELHAGADVAVEVADGGPFQLRRQADLLHGRLAHLDGAEPLQVGQPLQVQDAVDQLLGVAHLLQRQLAVALGEAGVAPVVAHSRVEEVLVDGGQLEAQVLVEQLDDTWIAPQWPSSGPGPNGVPVVSGTSPRFASTAGPAVSGPRRRRARTPSARRRGSARSAPRPGRRATPGR